jgi:hypothetical protein
MPYVYADVDALEGVARAGNGQCVAIVKTYGGAPQTALWTEGSIVKGSQTIAKGTAIATFVNGKYPN